MDDTELPEEAEGAAAARQPSQGGGGRQIKRARRPGQAGAAFASTPLAAAALATPSPARAVAMYPSLPADFEAYEKALQQGVAQVSPMGFGPFVAMVTSRRRGEAGADAQPAPRLAAALLSAD